MNQILPIFKKEFLGYFRSPVGYVILAVFHVAVIGMAIVGRYFETNEASLNAIFRVLPWILAVFIPATGMRLWAEEKRSGSIELLFTLPVSPRTAVFGKFLAALCFVAIGLALTFSLAFTTAYLGNPDWGVMISGYIGGLLAASAYLAITAVCSSMTKNQVIAFVFSVMLCFFGTLVGSEVAIRFLEDWVPTAFIELLNLMSFQQHFANMSQGLIDISALSFYVTLTLACLGINMIVLER